MKRVRCPKCDEFITFDETKYQEGQALVFVCPQCGKQFGIRIGKSKLRNIQKEENPDENLMRTDMAQSLFYVRFKEREREQPLADFNHWDEFEKWKLKYTSVSKEELEKRIIR